MREEQLSLAGVGVSWAINQLSDNVPLPPSVTGGYSAYVSQNYRFKRGDRVRLQWGRYAGAVGVVDSAVFHKKVDSMLTNTPLAPHVVLDDERVVTLRWYQLSGSEERLFK